MSSFKETAAEYFPGHIEEGEFAKRTLSSLEAYGFTEDNSIACVGTCRDEICLPLRTALREIWGEAFNFASLGGFLTLGRTGFVALHSHAPTGYDRRRHLYVCMPHIGIGTDGKLGACERPGLPGVSKACGALIAFHGELMSGELDLTLAMHDIEQSLLKTRLVKILEWGAKPDLGNMTKVAELAIRSDLEREIAATVDTNEVDYAVFTGVQIHAPGGQNFVWPNVSYAVIGGKRHSLNLTGDS